MADLSRLEYLVAGSEKHIGQYWALLSLDNDIGVDYVLYWIVEEQDQDTVTDLPAGDYMMVFLDMPEETAGSLYVQRIRIEEGQTATVTMP